MRRLILSEKKIRKIRNPKPGLLSVSHEGINTRLGCTPEFSLLIQQMIGFDFHYISANQREIFLGEEVSPTFLKMDDTYTE